MAQINFTPSSTMSPENAAKMVDLYGDQKDAPSKIDFKPAAAKIDFKFSAPKIDFKPASVKENHPVKDFVSRIGATAGKAVENIGEAVSTPLKEKLTPNIAANIGEVGGRAAGIAGNMFNAAAAVPTAAVSELAEDTGASEKLGTYVAGKEGAAPEQAKEIGKKLKGSTADVIGSSVVQAGAGALGGAKLPKEEVAAAAAKPKEPAAPEEFSTPKGVSDQLFNMSNKDEMRRIDAVNTLKGIRKIPNATWEKLYAYEDDPKGVQLTPEEKTIHDSTFSKMNEREKVLRAELTKRGVPMEEGGVGGAPRKVKGKNALVEKIYGNEKEAKRVQQGGKLSTYSATLQPRSMWAVADKSGKRSIVFIKDGRMFKDGEMVGEVADADTHPVAGTDTSLGKLAHATTKEVEEATNLEYHKNLLANKYINIMSLERANDASKFLDDMKGSTEFREHAASPGTKDLPEGWRKIHTENAAFDGWKFDPKMAEVFEDYLGNIKSPEEFGAGVMRVARAMKASIFYNPIKHMVNATNMFGTSLGAFGGAKSLATGRLPMALAKATRSVLTQDKELRTAVENGLSMPGLKDKAQQFHAELIRAMGRSVQDDPKAFNALAKKWGYKSSVGLVQGLYKGSSKLLWGYSDILTQTRYNLYRAEGLSPKQAAAKTHQLMADYRIPSRVAGSRGASKMLQDPRATMFGRYDYNRLANMGDTLMRAAKNDHEGWEARDQLLALAAITTIGYKVIDKILQNYTGEPDAHYGMGGYSSLADIGVAMGDGRKSPSQAAMTAMSPGLAVTPLELLAGQNMYTGKPIAQRGDFSSFMEGGDRAHDAASMGYDVGTYLADKFAPVQAVSSAITKDTPEKQLILEQLGASFPADNTKAAKYSRGAARSAAKKRPEWLP